MLNKVGGEYRCGYCGRPISRKVHQGHALFFTIDHIIPKEEGGRNTIKNAMLCCLQCNNNKRNLTLEQWREELGIETKFYFEELDHEKRGGSKIIQSSKHSC